MDDVLTVTPDRWMPRGEALVSGRRPIAVWSGIPGEPAAIRVDAVGQNRVHAHWLGSQRPDPHRVAPPCRRYALCGGCPLMHVDATGQGAARLSLVQDALDEAGLHDVSPGAWHPSPDGLEDFRHVVKLGFGRSDRGRIRVGAWARRTRRIVPIPECNVAHPVLRRTMNALAHHVIELDIWPWEPDSGRGTLRAAVIRASRHTGEVLITLVAGGQNKRLGELAEAVATQVPEVVGVWVHQNEDPGNAIFVRDEEGAVGVRPLLGKAVITERLGEVEYDVGPGDFFQTNPSAAALLYDKVIEALKLAQGVPFVDLYSGVGGLALQAARHTGWALGVEGVHGAVLRAREAARRQGIPAEFQPGLVEELLPDLARRLGASRPVVSVNPARRGLEPGVVEGILAMRPRRVAYISCNPRALARDLQEFRAAGYAIAPLQLFDMFPNTPHVEVVAVLEAPDADADAAERAPRRRRVRG